MKKRMVYRDGLEIPSFTVNVVLLVDTGNWYEESCAYSIYTDACTDFMYYTEKYVWKDKVFTKNDVSKIVDLIVASVKKKEVSKKLAMTK